jgi:hypothetical protein
MNDETAPNQPLEWARIPGDPDLSDLDPWRNFPNPYPTDEHRRALTAHVESLLGPELEIQPWQRPILDGALTGPMILAGGRRAGNSDALRRLGHTLSHEYRLHLALGPFQNALRRFADYILANSAALARYSDMADHHRRHHPPALQAGMTTWNTRRRRQRR